MLDGFGQAPVCIELDLDSYDGPWTHVERFRGRSGWLVVAEAHLSAADAEWETTLVAACDDYGEPVPPFMAPNLLACACSHPLPCRELPPDELDELLDAAAHELRLGWLRDTNRHLHDLSQAGADRVAAMEAATRAAVDEADRQVADLRRRRRMPGVTPHAIGLFNETITEIEVDREAALHRLAEERAKVRRAVKQEELTLLRRTSVSVTWEPLYHVSWSAAGRIGDDELAVRDHIANARYRAGGLAHNERQGRQEDGIARTSLLIPEPKRGSGVRKDEPPAGDPLEPHRKLFHRVRLLAGQVGSLHSDKLPIGQGYLDRMASLRQERAALASASDKPDPASELKHKALTDIDAELNRIEAMLVTPSNLVAAPPPTVAAQLARPIADALPTASRAEPYTSSRSDTVSVLAASSLRLPTISGSAVEMPMAGTIKPPTPQPPVNTKLKLERDMLIRQLGEVEETGSKFLCGSPKFERNRQQRVELAERIHAIDAQLAEPGIQPATTEPSLADQRAELEAELARHQNRGALLSEGANRYRQYRDRRLYLLGCIAELNQRIARQATRKEQK